MEERVIIKGKQANIKLVSLIIVCVGVVVFLSIYFWNYPIDNPCVFPYVLWIVPLYMSFTLLPFIIVAAVFYYSAKQVELIVTDKRVFGKVAFGKRVDLPLDMISAVGTSFLKGIAITTSSGAIKFLMIKNNEQIHTAISKLLMERQNTNARASRTVVNQEIPQSNAEELRKYKELLDLGVITQEEFNAKKKQLLGL